MHTTTEACGEKVTPNASQLSALTRLFSSAVFRELAKKGRSSLFRRLLEQTELFKRCNEATTVSDAFEAAFSSLRVVGMRDEYIYRAALTQKIMLGKHSLRTASMLNEFRAGACKADLVILNGTATVYEIKSERDSLTRLANQIANYKQVFASVNVIASESHIEGILATVPDEVGVLCLSRRFRISTVREAIDRPDCVLPEAIFDSLRTAEAADVLRAMGVSVPDVPNTQRHSAMRALFSELRPADLHRQMVLTLKRARDLAPLGDLVDRLPGALHAAALSVPIRRADHARLVNAIETPISATAAWI